MSDSQQQQSAADDPRPVFQGDWTAATGAEKGEHSERVRQWRERNGLPRQRAKGGAPGRMAASSGQPVPDAAAPAAAPAVGDAASRAVLTSIRDNPNAHDSDRIRAVQQLAALDRGEEAEGQGQSDLVALRGVLETLDPSERLAWLQGERVEGLGAGVPSA